MFNVCCMQSTVQQVSTDMTMGWVNPWVGSIHGLGWVGLGWVGLGWVGSKIFIITLGWVGLGQGLCGMHIQRLLTAMLCIDITKIRNRP